MQKKTHKPPSAKFILENTRELHKDEFEAIVEIAEFHESLKQADTSRKANVSRLYIVMETYFHWRAEDK